MNIRHEVTQKLIAALENNIIPWRRPWQINPNVGRPANVVSRKPYRGVNVLLLQLHALQYGFQSKWYATFKQWNALGGTIRKRPTDVEMGMWGCRIYFYRPMLKTTIDPYTGDERTGNECRKQFPVMRGYVVFCVDQVDGEALDQYRAEKFQTDEHAVAG